MHEAAATIAREAESDLLQRSLRCEDETQVEVRDHLLLLLLGGPFWRDSGPFFFCYGRLTEAIVRTEERFGSVRKSTEAIESFEVYCEYKCYDVGGEGRSDVDGEGRL